MEVLLICSRSGHTGPLLTVQYCTALLPPRGVAMHQVGVEKLSAVPPIDRHLAKLFEVSLTI